MAKEALLGEDDQGTGRRRARMLNTRRQLQELKAKVDEQSAMLAQVQDMVAELRRGAGEHATQQKDLQQSLRILTDITAGLERGVKDNPKWQSLPTDDAFWSTAHEPKLPFLIPFVPDMDVMLWIAHARFPTQPYTSIILPRSYAQRHFVRVPKSDASDAGESRAAILPETDIDKLPVDSYIALHLEGHAAPPDWIDTLRRLAGQSDLALWLVWFIEDHTEPSGNRIRVAAAYPRKPFKTEPSGPAEWNADPVLYFERHPSHRTTMTFPFIPVAMSPITRADDRDVPSSSAQ